MRLRVAERLKGGTTDVADPGCASGLGWPGRALRGEWLRRHQDERLAPGQTSVTASSGALCRSADIAARPGAEPRNYQAPGWRAASDRRPRSGPADARRAAIPLPTRGDRDDQRAYPALHATGHLQAGRPGPGGHLWLAAVPVFGSCSEQVRIYWAKDDFVGGSALLGLNATVLDRRERRVAASADLLVASNPVVADTWRSRGLERTAGSVWHQRRCLHRNRGCPAADGCRPSSPRGGLHRPYQ